MTEIELKVQLCLHTLLIKDITVENINNITDIDFLNKLAKMWWGTIHNFWMDFEYSDPWPFAKENNEWGYLSWKGFLKVAELFNSRPEIDRETRFKISNLKNNWTYAKKKVNY